MLEKPNISEQLIVSSLQHEYGLGVISLTFLPLGAKDARQHASK